MVTLLSIIAILASIFLVFIVMVQNSKGGGLDSSFGAVNQLGNVAQSTDTVEKVTWYTAAIIAGACLISSVLLAPKKEIPATDGQPGVVENTEVAQ